MMFIHLYHWVSRLHPQIQLTFHMAGKLLQKPRFLGY